MRSYKLDGIVIKRRNFGEADRIITIFSKDKGKIELKAKGVRRIVSRRSSHIELLNYCKFNVYQGKQLPILTEVESREDFVDIKNDLQKIGYAYHLCELIDGLCAENQENSEIFMLLGKTLRKISILDDAKEAVKEFEHKLLSLLGFNSAEVRLNYDTHEFIENILERRLKSKQVLFQIS